MLRKEVRAFRERKKRSVWFRELVENCVVYGDRGYRGCEGVIVCGSREMWAKRRRKIVRRDNGKVVEFEEVRYGMYASGW